MNPGDRRNLLGDETLLRQEKLSATHTCSGVNFRPALYNLQDEQRSKSAISFEENEVFAVNLSIRGDDEAVVWVRLIEPNQICFVGH
jgi:hypothetical protein